MAPVGLARSVLVATHAFSAKAPTRCGIAVGNPADGSSGTHGEGPLTHPPHPPTTFCVSHVPPPLSVSTPRHTLNLAHPHSLNTQVSLSHSVLNTQVSYSHLCNTAPLTQPLLFSSHHTLSHHHVTHSPLVPHVSPVPSVAKGPHHIYSPHAQSVSHVTSVPHHIYSPPPMGSQTVYYASHAQTVSHVTGHIYSPPLMGSCNVPHTSQSFSDVTGILEARDITHHAVVTPIDATRLHHYLQAHPNRHLTNYLVDAFRGGFRIGHKGPRIAHHAPNLTSAFVHPEVIDRVLAKEVSLGRIAGPFSSPPFSHLQCSGLGLVPKDGADWRLIFHLSAPEGASVNDSIPADDFSLRYHTIDDAMDILHGLGPNALMGKADLKSIDWPLLGIHCAILRGQVPAIRPPIITVPLQPTGRRPPMVPLCGPTLLPLLGRLFLRWPC